MVGLAGLFVVVLIMDGDGGERAFRRIERRYWQLRARWRRRGG